MAVRFGNVLGSSGSAIPIFEKQIKLGGPLTITHPEMTRYFMSIQEASQLILQCAALGREGEIFLLDMGKPIKILHLARDLIRLSGYEPESDIPIVYTGLRPGEKLYEELQLKHEKKINTEHQKIMILENKTLVDDWISLKSSISILLKAGNNMDLLEIKDSLEFILPSYIPRSLSKSNIKNNEDFKIQA
jgi:FlaA1/EpsC-like NDP-sugar epimerase